MTIDLEKSYNDVNYATKGGDVVKIERDKGDTWRGEVTPVIISSDVHGSVTHHIRILYNRDGTTVNREESKYDLCPDGFELVDNMRQILLHKNTQPLFPSMKNLPRPVVLWMAEQMEQKLAVNDYKGGWDNYASNWLFERLLKEMAELFNALIRYQNEKDYQNIIMECADVNNFSLMIADVINKKFNKGKE